MKLSNEKERKKMGMLKKKTRRGDDDDDDDDEANASDVVSRDRRPSSSTTKAQHREATHKYIYAWARCVDATIIFSPLVAGNRGRSLRFRFPLPPRYLLLLLHLILFFILFVLFFSRSAQHHAWSTATARRCHWYFGARWTNKRR